MQGNTTARIGLALAEYAAGNVQVAERAATAAVMYVEVSMHTRSSARDLVAWALQGALLLAQITEARGTTTVAIAHYQEAHRLCKEQHGEGHELAVQVLRAAVCRPLLPASCKHCF